VVAAAAWGILCVLAWARWSCLMAVILGFSLIPVAALVIGYGAFVLTSTLTQRPAALPPLPNFLEKLPFVVPRPGLCNQCRGKSFARGL
jgi:hypothetical protein